MARRPKKIDLNAITDTSHPLHKKHCDSLVDDLLRKHPRGPECKLTRGDYRTHWNGHDLLENAAENMASNCGYEDLILYRLAIALNNDASEWDWKYYSRARWPELGQRGHTRRARRLNARVEGAYRRTMRAGRPGIYKVRFGYDGRRSEVYVHAENSEMAAMVAGTSMGCCYTEAPEASFEREGCASELMGLNSGVVDTTSRLVASKHEEIAKLHKEIELLDLRAAMIQTYSISAVGS